MSVVTYFNSRYDNMPHNLLEGAKGRFMDTISCFVGFSLKKMDESYNFADHNSAKWARLNKFEGEIDLEFLNASILSDTIEWFLDPT